MEGKYLRVWSGDSSDYGDRSSALMGLTSRLLRQGVTRSVTVGAIAALDAAHYNKFVDRPQYYQKMIEAANIPEGGGRGSDSLESGGTDDYLHGNLRYFIKDGAYWKGETKKGKGDEYYEIESEISNFIFDDPALVLLEGDQWLSTKVHVDGRYHSRADFLIPSANFKNKLPSLGGGMWMGSDNDLACIIRWVQRDAPTYTGVAAVGQHTIDGKRYFITDGETYDANGVVEDSSVRLVRRFGGTIRTSYNGSAHSDRRVSGELLLGLNTPAVVWPLLGWTFAAPFAPLIRAETGHFPILSIFGSPGAGKTAGIEQILRFIRGFQPDLLKASTLFTLLSELSSTNAVPLVYDEVRSRDRGGQALLSLLKELYSGSVAKRGTASQKVNEYPLLAPTVIVAEIDQRGSDAALSDRILPLYLPPKDRRTDAMSEAYYKLRGIKDEEASAFAYQYMLYTLNVDFKKMWKEAANLERADESDREMDNIAAAVLGATCFVRFCGLDDDLIDEAVEHIGALYAKDNNQGSGRVQPPLWTWLEQVSTMAHLGRIEANRDYMHDGKTIRLHKASVWKVYQREFERDPEKVEATSHTIGRWIEENPGGIVIKADTPMKIGEKMARGTSFSVDKCTEAGIDVSGFLRGVN